jgi:hypothetical protein
MNKDTLKKFALIMLAYDDALSNIAPYALRLWHDEGAGVACTVTMDAGVFTMHIDNTPDGIAVCVSGTAADGSFIALPQTLHAMEVLVDVGRMLQFMQDRTLKQQ